MRQLYDESDLIPFQVKGVEFLCARPAEINGKPHRYLGDEMGLGKTVQGVAAAKKLGLKSGLIVCPVNAKKAWLRHLVEWGVTTADQICIVENSFDYIDVKKPWVIVNPELFDYEIVFKQLYKRTYDVVIVDEAHRFKSLHSSRTNLLFGRKGYPLIAKGYWKWLMSGSAMPNRPAELFPALKVLVPEVIAPYDDWMKYGMRFCNGYTDSFGAYNFKGASNIDELKERIRPFFLRRTGEEVYDQFPEVLLEQLYIDIPPMDEDETNTPLPVLQDLIGRAKVPYIVDYIKRQQMENGEKYLIFAFNRQVINDLISGFTAPSSLDGLEKPLPAVKAKCIHGDISKAERDKIHAEFISGDLQDLVYQITAGGTSLDGLQYATRNVFHAQTEWGYGTWAQSIGRVRRIGQKLPVLLTETIASNTVDEVIMHTNRAKGRVNLRLFGTKTKEKVRMLEDSLKSIDESLKRLVDHFVGKAASTVKTVAEAVTQEASAESQAPKRGRPKAGDTKSEEVKKGPPSKNGGPTFEEVRKVAIKAVQFGGKENEERQRERITEVFQRAGFQSLEEVKAAPESYAEIIEALKAITAPEEEEDPLGNL